MTVDYARILHLVLPEAILALTALVVLGVDALVLRQTDRNVRLTLGGIMASAGCGLAIAALMLFPMRTALAGDLFTSDALTRVVKSGVILLAAFSLWIPAGNRGTPHIGEHFAIMLFATIGMLLLASAEDLLMVFLGLELTSLSLYVLAGFNTGDRFGSEASLKYFLLGGIAAAFTLFGLSLLYGATGTLELRRLAELAGGPKLDPLFLLGVGMTVTGFGFKTAAVPFHFWAPDVYAAAPLPGTALIASGSKVAGFYILAKLLMTGMPGAAGAAGWHHFQAGWMPLIAVIAALSMVAGNLAAIVQTSVRRLLAYSAVAHAGYVMLGILANSARGMDSLIYYTITYGLAVLGAFAVAGHVQACQGNDRLEDFAGLSRRSPGIAFCMLIFLLSLAGIPPLAGFFGKFYVFAAALQAGSGAGGLLWLVALALGMSAVSLYYYLQILKQVYRADARQSQPGTAGPAGPGVFVGILAGLVILLGIAPEIILSLLREAMRAV